jgi:rubredoxin
MGRWKVEYGAEVVGYVYDVKPGPVESVNCGARRVADRDTYIELVLNPRDSSATHRVIVKVTPRWRAIMGDRGVDWSMRALRDHFLGRWVRVCGWMLFDSEHKGEAENIAPGRPRNWRATAWEVYPVTSIEAAPRPR